MKQRFTSWHTPNKMFTFVAKIAAVAPKRAFPAFLCKSRKNILDEVRTP